MTSSKRSSTRSRSPALLLVPLWVTLLAATGQRARLPEPYVEHNVCPFECCQYGPWTAVKAMTAYRDAGSKSVAFRLPARASFVADSGEMHFAQLGRVRVDRPVTLAADERHVEVPRGATVFVLSYQGEGSYHVWYDGQFYDTDSFWDDRRELPRPTGRPAVLVREGKQVWWVHVTRAGRGGWLRMDEASVSGADACG